MQREANGQGGMAAPVKVLLVSSHVVQYASPLYRLYASDPRLDIRVVYCSLQGARSGLDPDFGVEVEWDVPLLDGYQWVHPPNRSSASTLGGFWSLINPGLWRIVRKGRYDVVVCYGYRAVSFWIAALAATFSGAALVLTSDAPTLQRPGLTRWMLRLKRWVVPRIFRFAHAVLAPSSASADLFVGMGVPREDVFLVPFTVDTARFASPSRDARSKLRGKLGIGTDEFVYLFVGKFIPRKRPIDLVEAAMLVPGIHVAFCGDGPLRQEIEAAAADHDRIHLVGFINQSQLPDIYAAADALVVTSDYDPFPVVVMEAMASGRPAVVSGVVGSIGDLVVHGLTGTTFPVGDVDALASRLRELAGDSDLWRTMSGNARARMEEWGPTQNAAAFAMACLTVASRSGRAQDSA